jgi:hypothetical protein
MQTISITYTLVYEISFAHHYKFTKCKKLINCQRCKEVKKVMNGGSIGYCIESKFYTLSNLRKYLQKIKVKEKTPWD